MKNLNDVFSGVDEMFGSAKSRSNFEDVLQSMMSKDSANKLIKTRKLERKQQEQYFE